MVTYPPQEVEKNKLEISDSRKLPDSEQVKPLVNKLRQRVLGLFRKN